MSAVSGVVHHREDRDNDWTGVLVGQLCVPCGKVVQLLGLCPLLVYTREEVSRVGGTCLVPLLDRGHLEAFDRLVDLLVEVEAILSELTEHDVDV